MCTHHGARDEGKLRLQEVGSRYLNLFVFFYQITVHVPMKSQVIGICGDAVPTGPSRRTRSLSPTHTAGGEYLAVPIGRAQEQLALCLASSRGDGPESLVPQGTTVILGGSCPAVAYQQGAADYCVAYGAASACFTPATTPPPRRSLASPRRRCTAAMRSASSATFFTLSTAGASAAVKHHDPFIASINTPVILQVAPH